MPNTGKKRKWHPLERLGLYRILPLHRVPISLGMKILIVFLMIIGIGFLITLRLSLNLIYDHIWRETQDKLRTDLKICRMIYDYALSDLDAVVDFTAGRIFLVNDLQQGLYDQLRVQLERIRHDRGLDIFTLIDPTGVVRLRTAPPYQVGDDLSNDELVRQALQGTKASGNVVLTRDRLVRESEDLALRAGIQVKPTEHALPPALQSVEAGMFMMSAYPVRKQSGEVIGVLCGGKMINNNFALADSVMARIFPDSEGKDVNYAMVSIFFWDVRITTTLRTPNGIRATGYLLYDQVSEAVLHNGQNWLGTSWVHNDWYFAAYEPIKDPDGKVIGALGLGLWKGPFIAIRDNLLRQYIKFSVLGLISATLLGMIFSRMLTKPLRGLVDASEELAKGNLDYRIKLKSGKDEIRDLESAFNSMAEKLRAYMSEKDQLTVQLQNLNQRYMELLGFASHEIKQPIAVIMGTVANLRKLEPETISRNLENVLDRLQRNITQIASMTEKYLNYSKIESGQIQLSEQRCRLLAEVLDPVIEGEQKPMLERQMKLALLQREHLAGMELFVDPAMLRVVFANLISNAVKYGQPGSEIQLGTEECGDHVRFFIRNDGEGIPGNKLQEIFGKFVRLENTRRSQKGTGLGLYNVKEIVELHGGKIWAESEPGKWAKFTLTLPKERVTAGRAAPDEC